MFNLQEIREMISEILGTEEKAYLIPAVCEKYGLDSGSEDEAYKSKRKYVLKRLASKDEESLYKIARQVARDYHSTTLLSALGLVNESGNVISNITRKNLIDGLNLLGNIPGKLDLIDFLKRIWMIEKMPSTDYRFTNAAGDIYQHMVNNDDWDYEYLFCSYLGLTDDTDEMFLFFLEQVVHPVIREPSEQEEYVKVINKHLAKDGYELKISEYISSYPLYRAIKISDGVVGNPKNLIFAANGPKPEIVLTDSINNNIEIVKNEEYCLVYDLPIPQTGLLWSDLVSWWANLSKKEISIELERQLYNRLFESLDSEPERLLFDTYYREYRNKTEGKFPALIPQVYLHYDPYTIKELKGNKRIERQRMDFLILFSNRERVVIEIDGKQHYSNDNGKANTEKYSQMVRTDRDLRLKGYEIYRFGGFELANFDGKQILESFFNKLFEKHRLEF